MGYSVVLVTVPSQEEGERIARGVLERKLAACANIIPGVQSLFWWQGRLEETIEALMVLKTKAEALPQLIEAVRDMHSYAVCEVIEIPVGQGNRAYLDWIEDTVQPQ